MAPPPPPPGGEAPPAPGAFVPKDKIQQAVSARMSKLLAAK